MSRLIIAHAQTVRSIVLQQLQAIPESWFDLRVEAFPNTIRWNVGHLAVAFEQFMPACIPNPRPLPASYADRFRTGTKPSDWTTPPPSKEDLLRHLGLQLETIAETDPGLLDGRFDSPVEMGPLAFTTVGELFQFVFFHEALHLGIISAMAKIVQAEADGRRQAV